MGGGCGTESGGSVRDGIIAKVYSSGKQVIKGRSLEKLYPTKVSSEQTEGEKVWQEHTRR